MANMNTDSLTVLSLDEYTGVKPSDKGAGRSGRGRGDAFPSEQIIECSACGYKVKCGRGLLCK